MLLSFIWKPPVVVLLALPLAATALLTRAQTDPATRAPCVQPPTDGLAQLKRAATHAVDVAAVRAAIRAFAEQEGRAPTDLGELIASGYLPPGHAATSTRFMRYDPSTGEVYWPAP